jgi:hypothetical protein
MCLKDAKTNFERLGIFVLLRRSSTTWIRWAKFCSLLFYLCISFPSYYLVTFFTWFDLFFVFPQCVISIVEDVVMKMYYEEFPQEADDSLIKLK